MTARLAVASILLGVLVAIQGCAPEPHGSEDAQPDTQYLPDGVSIADHQVFRPTGENFQGHRIHPPFWWTEMENDTLQILIYDRNVKGHGISIVNPGVDVIRVDSVPNPNYLFATVVINDQAIPGRFPIMLTDGPQAGKTYLYELQRRLVMHHRIDPVNPSDLIYLVMPDRFANGDTTNDSVEDLLQKGVDRRKMYFRHGGDLQGIIDHLSYLEDLGVTALWLTPVLVNDQPYASYHGYAITDHYTVDPRFGNNDLYIQLASRSQAQGIKVIKDLVFNHVGHMHWFVQDIPSIDWVHQYSSFTRTNFSIPSLRDPYASTYDKNLMNNGWFDHSMPDLNQGHPLLAAYLIQNAIWWIELAGIDGFRLDTYPFGDQDFMREMGRRVQQEYPDFYYFGETTVHYVPLQSQFVGGSVTSQADNPMPGVTDFVLRHALIDALTDAPDYNNGVQALYQILAQDFVYKEPVNNVTFLDNHDTDRISSLIGNDSTLLKSAISLLLTLRGTPCVYYGTELGMSGMAAPDGLVRSDFPGGWGTDTTNKFEESGRTPREQDLFTHFRHLADVRKNSKALTTGYMVHFAPQGNDGIYTYFRYTAQEQFMVVYNANDSSRKVGLSRFGEMIGDVALGFEHTTRNFINLTDSLEVPGKTTFVIDTRAE